MGNCVKLFIISSLITKHCYSTE